MILDSRGTSRLQRAGLTTCLSLVFTFSAGLACLAQSPTKPRKDDALEELLGELKAKDSKPTADAKSGAKEKETPKPKAPTSSNSPKPAAAPKPGSTQTPGAKPAEVTGKDKDLDSLLEKLGETRDKPSPDERPRGGAAGPPDEPGAGGGKPKDDDAKNPAEPKAGVDPLTGKARELDEHLEELTGRRRKKKDGKDEGGSGPLGDVVKQMREVEKRLDDADTGEETRKKQQQIVKNLETLIEQMRSSSSHSKRRQKQVAMQPGQQPGQPGQQPGTTGGNAPFTKAEKPTNKRSLGWRQGRMGHLPPELRQELENVFKEEFLPAREELIRKYYDALARKAVKRGE